MDTITLNNQSFTTDATNNYGASVKMLKEAAKPFTDGEGVINITRETTADDAKKIENYASDIGKLITKGEAEDIQQALGEQQILGNKLANLLGCKAEVLPNVLSDLNKSVDNLPNILGSLLVASEDKKFQEMCNMALSAAEPFMNAVTDSDMRELMKLLIAVFAQLLTTQRENDLLNLNNLMTAFNAKIADMEKSKEKQYKAAITQAVTGIVMGSISLGMTLGAAALQGISAARTAKENGLIDEVNQNLKDKLMVGGITDRQYDVAALKTLDVTSQKMYQVGQFIGQSAQPVSQIGQGGAGVVAAGYEADAKDADREMTMEEMVMEVVRKAQEQNQSVARALTDFINNILSMIQQLIQNASQTEKTIAA